MKMGLPKKKGFNTERTRKQVVLIDCSELK